MSRTKRAGLQLRTAVPHFIPPQLATLAFRVPTGEDWIFEPKLDGYRILARLENGEVTLRSRNDKDWTAKFPSITRALKGFQHDAYLDGEIMASRDGKRATFQTLQNAFGVRAKNGSAAKLATTLHYHVFDILWLDGRDLRPLPLRERKSILKQTFFPVEVTVGPISYLKHRASGGRQLFSAACEEGAEGIICKHANEPYVSGRTREWLKLKCSGNEEFVIGGYTRLKDRPRAMGALLLGQFEGNRLRYCGRVGTGFSLSDREIFGQVLSEIAQEDCPFTPRPKVAKAIWVQPRIVAQVAFTEKTNDGLLRHPSFIEIREDKKAPEVKFEVAYEG